MLSQVKPNIRSSHPLPLPSASPPTPVSDTRPPVTASPCSVVAASSSAHSAPPWTRAVRASGSTRTAFIGRRSITIPPSQVL